MRMLLIACGVAVSLLAARAASAQMLIDYSDVEEWQVVELPDGTADYVWAVGTERTMSVDRTFSSGRWQYYFRYEKRETGTGSETGIHYTFTDGFTFKLNLNGAMEDSTSQVKRMISQGSNPNIWAFSLITHSTMNDKGEVVVDFDRSRR